MTFLLPVSYLFARNNLFYDSVEILPIISQLFIYLTPYCDTPGADAYDRKCAPLQCDWDDAWFFKNTYENYVHRPYL
jgi:hypothetical protein